MKVKIIMNKEAWDISKELLAVKRWFSKYVKLEFEVKKVYYEKLGWMSNSKYFKKYWLQNEVFDNTADIYVLNIPKYQWEPKDALGYAYRFDSAGQKFISMTSSEKGKRKQSKGWLDGNEFAGRLRHELCHTFYQLTGEDERVDDTWKVHIFEKSNISKVLKDIKWENLKS